MTNNSKKEAKLLKEIETFQSSRDFKTGLKASEKILKKNPKNAEAIAWKSYFTYMQNPSDNKDLALSIFKDAIRLSGMKNANVWKIYGNLYKEMQDFQNALKCMLLAYKNNPEDYGILNEQATLNLYLKNYGEYLKNTVTFINKFSNSYSISRYIFALAMNKQYEKAVKISTLYQQGWKPVTNEDELLMRSEFCLFKCMLYMRCNQYQECLDYIKENANNIRDFELMTENKIECLRKLNRNEEVIPLVHELLKIYPENGDYFDILEALTPEDKYIDELLKLKENIHSKYAHVRALELMDINDERFKPLLAQHLRPLFDKGAPAIYMTIKEFSNEKLNAAVEYAKSIINDVPLSSIPIIHLFIAHYYGYNNNNYDKAMEHLNIGLQHTATCIECLGFKVRFSAKYGRIKQAIQYGREYRKADPNDRNTNLAFVKVLLLGGRRKEAEYEAVLFSGIEKDKPLIYETQFNKYYLMSGLSALRCGDFEFADKMYRGILTNFEDYRKNEFHYLNWSWRRPRALFEMIETINSIENNEWLAKAIEMLLTLAIKDKKTDDAKEIAKRALNGNIPRALYIACIIFCANRNSLPALRCFLKLKDTPYIYGAIPSIEKLVKDIDSFDPRIQHLIKSEYHPHDKEPTTYHDFYYSGFGKWAIGQINEAKSDFNKAIEEFSISFKEALDLYVFLTITSGNSEFSELSKKLETKYPEYEFLPDKETEPFVLEGDICLGPNEVEVANALGITIKENEE